MNTQIVTVAHTKGGVGKTTLAVLMAAMSAEDQHQVLVINGDRQTSAQLALTFRENAEVAPYIHCEHKASGQELLETIKTADGKYSRILIDVGGYDSTAFRAALACTHQLLIPLPPEAFDTWALHDLMELIDQALEHREDAFQIQVVINKSESKEADQREVQKLLEDFPKLSLIGTPIGRRRLISNAASRGQMLSRSNKKHESSIEELTALYSSIFN